MKTENEELSSPRLKKLGKDLAKVEKAEDYLDVEREKLVKEKEILRLKKQIERVRNKKQRVI